MKDITSFVVVLLIWISAFATALYILYYNIELSNKEMGDRFVKMTLTLTMIVMGAGMKDSMRMAMGSHLAAATAAT